MSTVGKVKGKGWLPNIQRDVPEWIQGGGDGLAGCAGHVALQCASENTLNDAIAICRCPVLSPQMLVKAVQKSDEEFMSILLRVPGEMF